MALVRASSGSGSGGSKGHYESSLSYNYYPNNYTYIECDFTPKYVYYEVNHVYPVVVFGDCVNNIAYYWYSGAKNSVTFSQLFDVQGTQLGLRGSDPNWHGAINLVIVG